MTLGIVLHSEGERCFKVQLCHRHFGQIKFLQREQNNTRRMFVIEAVSRACYKNVCSKLIMQITISGQLTTHFCLRAT